MIKKTGREIHRLRKAKLGHGELDKHMFQEKMASLTTSKCQVPPLLMLNEDILTMTSSRSSTLKHAEQLLLPGLTPGPPEPEPGPELDHSSSSSTCSTPTPHLKSGVNRDQENVERFSYEIDPDIGVIV